MDARPSLYSILRGICYRTILRKTGIEALFIYTRYLALFPQIEQVNPCLIIRTFTSEGALQSLGSKTTSCTEKESVQRTTLPLAYEPSPAINSLFFFYIINLKKKRG